jgi:hypothetical protein
MAERQCYTVGERAGSEVRPPEVRWFHHLTAVVLAIKSSFHLLEEGIFQEFWLFFFSKIK